MMEKIMIAVQLAAMFIAIVCYIVSEINRKKTEQDLEKIHEIQLDIITGDSNIKFEEIEL